MGLSVKAKEMVKFLKSNGFWIERTTSHHILTNGVSTVPVSKHDNEELKPGTLNGILGSVKLTRKELEKWLGRN
jgi:predicted RNA binding protein YcfA (HicA-like mRNA interferase family)